MGSHFKNEDPSLNKFVYDTSLNDANIFESDRFVPDLPNPVINDHNPTTPSLLVILRTFSFGV